MSLHTSEMGVIEVQVCYDTHEPVSTLKSMHRQLDNSGQKKNLKLFKKKKQQKKHDELCT